VVEIDALVGDAEAAEGLTLSGEVLFPSSNARSR
jgi:hypothetical protein